MSTSPAPRMPTAIDGLRVLAFADWYTPDASGGAERAAWETYRRLGAAGARVHVVSATHGPPHQDPGVEVTAIKSYDLSHIAGGYFAPAPAAFTATKRLVRDLEPAALLACTIHYTGCLAAARTSATTGIPLVVTAQLGPLDHLPALDTSGRWRVRAHDRSLHPPACRRSPGGIGGGASARDRPGRRARRRSRLHPTASTTDASVCPQ